MTTKEIKGVIIALEIIKGRHEQGVNYKDEEDVLQNILYVYDEIKSKLK